MVPAMGMRSIRTKGGIAALMTVSALVFAACGDSSSTTYRLKSVDESFTPFGFAGDQPKDGDRFYFVSGLFNRGRTFGRADGARVGRGDALCTMIDAKAQRL